MRGMQAMPPQMPWNVAGVSAQVREAARAAARREGLSLGEWLERRIAAGQEMPNPPPAGASASNIGAEDFDRFAGRIEAALSTLERRIELAEQNRAAQAENFGRIQAKTDGMLSDQGLVVDRLVSQFMDLSQRLEAVGAQLSAYAPDGLRQDMAALGAALGANLGSEAKAQAAAMAIGIAALDDKIAGLRADCAAAFAALEDRLTPTALPPPPPVSPTTAAPEPVPEEDEYPAPPPFVAPQPEPPQRRLDFTTRREEDSAPSDMVADADASMDDDGENRRSIPVAPLVLIVAAAVVAAAGLWLSREPSVAGWYHLQVSAGAPPAGAPPPMTPAKADPQPAQTAPQASQQPSDAGAPPDPQARLKSLAEGGNAKAALVLGLEYYEGRGVSADAKQAMTWLERAARGGEPVAQFRLGDIYERGRGVTADAARAATLFQSAAGKGHRQAMARLAAAYAAGAGVKRDYGEAARWFAKAAQSGLTDPQFNLAVLYEQGKGVPQNLIEAYKWYAIAAAAGDGEARNRMTVLAGQLSAEDRRQAKAAADAFRPAPVDPAANATPRAADVLR